MVALAASRGRTPSRLSFSLVFGAYRPNGGVSIPQQNPLVTMMEGRTKVIFVDLILHSFLIPDVRNHLRRGI